MAFQVKNAGKKFKGGKIKGAGDFPAVAAGNAPDTGSPGFTPAPTRPAAPDVISAPRHGTPAGYGMNSDAGAVSLVPGQQRLSPLAANMKATRDDPALDAVISGQPIGNTGPTGQERPIDPTPYPTTHGMRDRSGE